MSLTAQDLIRIPYDDSLTLAGVTYACRSLHYSSTRIRHISPYQLRRRVAAVAAELAFRRWLETESAPYSLLQTMPFTQPDRYSLTIGGHRLEVKTTFITSRQHIRRLRQEPSWLLQAEALISIDQLSSETLDAGDPYVFIFLTGLETRTQSDLRRALAAAQPTYLIAAPPVRAWRQARAPRPLGCLALKSDDPHSIEIELGGQLADHRFHIERKKLLPGQHVELSIDLISLFYMHPNRPPTGPISAYSPALRRTWTVNPHTWSNIWIYGLEVILVGWYTKGVFRRRASFLPTDSQTLLGRRTRRDNRALPISQLRPMQDLIDRLRQG